jgi:uncharacterized membrane protein
MNEEIRRPLLNHLCGDMTARDRHNLQRANLWLAGWLVSLAAATWLQRAAIVDSGPMAWVVAVLPTAIAVVTLLSFGRFLRQADELQRSIQLQALALGFGVGLFAGFGFRLLEGLGVPPATTSDISVFMAFFYFVGLWLGRRRYA